MLSVFAKLKTVLDGNYDPTLARGSITGMMSKSIIECSVIIPKRLINHEHREKAVSLQMDLFAANISMAFKALVELHSNKEVQYAFNLVSSKTVVENALSYESQVPSAAYSDEALFPLDMSNVSIENEVPKIYREVEVKISLSDDKKITIPLLIVCPVIYATAKEMDGAILANSGKNSLPQRWDDYKSGAISLMNLITGNDIIADYLSNAKNPNRILKNINTSRTKSILRLATTKAEGFVKYYRLVVISNKELEQLELVYGGRITKTRVKEKCLDTFSALMICVLDDDFGTFDIYIRDIAEKLTMPYKSAQKDSMSDVFKFMTNRTI